MVVKGESLSRVCRTRVSSQVGLYPGGARGLLACQLTSCGLVALMQQRPTPLLCSKSVKGFWNLGRSKNGQRPNKYCGAFCASERLRKEDSASVSVTGKWWWNDGAANLRGSLCSFLPRAARVGRS